MTTPLLKIIVGIEAVDLHVLGDDNVDCSMSMFLLGGNVSDPTPGSKIT